jgi:hypothetical protein
VPRSALGPVSARDRPGGPIRSRLPLRAVAWTPRLSPLSPQAPRPACHAGGRAFERSVAPAPQRLYPCRFRSLGVTPHLTASNRRPRLVLCRRPDATRIDAVTDSCPPRLYAHHMLSTSTEEASMKRIINTGHARLVSLAQVGCEQTRSDSMWRMRSERVEIPRPRWALRSSRPGSRL